ncbi:MAG: ABC transporter permease, partial [Acidobacteriota bacterium]
MLDAKTRLVAAREVVENVRTKAFWIGILMFPVILALSIIVPTLIEKNRSARLYTVIDHSDWLLEAVEKRAAFPDLEKVFRHALDLKRSEDEKFRAEFEALPEQLRQTILQLEVALPMVQAQLGDDADFAEAESKVLGGFAATISGLSGPRGERLRSMVPAAAMAELESLRNAVRDWWQELPADEAKEFGGAVTKDRYVRQDPPPGEGEALIEELNKLVLDEKLFAYFIIDEDPVNGEKPIKYVSSNLTDEDLSRWFKNLATEAVRDVRLQEKEIDPDLAQWLQAPVEVESKKLGSGGEEAVDATDRVRQWAPVAFVYLLWIAIFSIAQMLLTNTVEEKSNRIMEVLLSSVSPLQLMIGKIAGIAATGLLMVVSWMLFLVVAVKGIPLFMSEQPSVDLTSIATDAFYLGSFVIYFLLGYLFFASLLVAIGSVCNSLKEAQNLQSPVMIMLMVPLFAMMPIAQDPNGPLAKFLSYVPPFTPFVMMNRAAGPPAPWE